MKNIILFIALIGNFHLIAQPANDNCASATVLTVNGTCVTGTTQNATIQTGEPCQNGGGVTDETVWYRFTATQSSMVLDFIKTNTTNCATQLSVYGPNPPCVPTTANAIVNCQILTGDPGLYQNLTGLTVGASYYVQIDGNSCGGGNDRFANFCIGIYTPASNTSLAGATVIDQCGTAYNGTTMGGYFPDGSSLGFNNLDNNAGTSVAGASEVGDDVTFVINNDSWFKFCATTAGQWQISFTVGTCKMSGLSSGAQMAILTGTSSSLTNLAQAPSPTASGSNYTSPILNVAAGQCIYLLVDGFSGDACNYSYTLTNISGGCNLALPIDLAHFSGDKSTIGNLLNWVVYSEKDNAYFSIENSLDGISWNEIGKMEGAGTINVEKHYNFVHREFEETINYYRLKQVDFNGSYTYSNTITIDNRTSDSEILHIFNTVGQEVDIHYQGIKIIHYKNGKIEKKY